MARIVSGGSKLFTSEAFGNPLQNQPVKVGTGGDVRLNKFLQGLKVADELASNKLIGAGVGLLGEGVRAIGRYQEEQAKLEQAQKAEAEQTALNKAEAEKLSAEQQALKAKAQEKLGMQAVASPDEVSAVETGLDFRNKQDQYYNGLRQVISQYQADAKLAPKIGDYLRQGVKSGFITDDQAKKVAGALEAKALGREQELLQQEKALPTEQQVARPAVELAMKQEGIARDVKAKAITEQERVMLEETRADKLNNLRNVIRSYNAGADIPKVVSSEEIDLMYDLVDESKGKLKEAQDQLASLPDTAQSTVERARLETEIESQKQSILDMRKNIVDRQVNELNNTIQGIEERQKYDPNAEYNKQNAPIKAQAEAMKAETRAEREGVKPPAPAEPTAPQPQEDVLPFAVKPRVQREFEEKVLPRGKEGLVKVLQALDDIKSKSGGKLSEDQQQLYDLSVNELKGMINRERESAQAQYLKEARAEVAQGEVLTEGGIPKTETTGRVTDAKGRILAGQTRPEDVGTLKAGQKASTKPIPEMGRRGLEPSVVARKLEAEREQGKVPAGMSIVEYDLGDELAQKEAEAEAVRKGGAPQFEQFKSLEAQQVFDQAVKEPNEARKKALVEEAKRLEEQATAKATEAQQVMQRKAELPKGVTRDEKGNLVIEPTKTYNETELLAMASNARTLDERKKVLELIDANPPSPTSILDMMTGAHKVRFADKVRTYFPTARDLPKAPTKTQAEIDAEIALKNARTKKLLTEVPEISKNAESLRASRQSQVDKNTAGANDLRAKTGAEINGVDYWESVIVRNLRKPAGRSGKSRADRAKSYLDQVMRVRAQQKTDTEKSHNALIDVTKSEVKELQGKKDALAKEFGDQPTAPTEPKRSDYNTSKAYNDATEKFAKEKRQYDDNVKAQKAVDAKLKDASDRLQQEETAKQRDLDDIDTAFDSVSGKLEAEVYGKPLPKKTGAPATKRPAKPQEQKTGKDKVKDLLEGE